MRRLLRRLPRRPEKMQFQDLSATSVSGDAPAQKSTIGAIGATGLAKSERHSLGEVRASFDLGSCDVWIRRPDLWPVVLGFRA